jgi:hypothetical protein
MTWSIQEFRFVRVALFNQHDTHFATFDMPELPREGDIIEIAFPNEQPGKSFIVERVVHQMVYDTEHVQHEIDAPWHWELRLYGELEEPYEEAICVCAQGVTKCPKHGDQPAVRDICPLCNKAVLGYCAQGQYCTSEDCKYVA